MVICLENGLGDRVADDAHGWTGRCGKSVRQKWRMVLILSLHFSLLDAVRRRFIRSWPPHQDYCRQASSEARRPVVRLRISSTSSAWGRTGYFEPTVVRLGLLCGKLAYDVPRIKHNVA